VASFLIDEMFPPAATELLRKNHGYGATHVNEAGLGAVDDTQVAAAARAEGRPVVTENVADFAAERDLVLVFVLKRKMKKKNTD
jgi:predicted nuclease of predicted toxin-antitoxin system